jgi:Ca2+-binding RTX toxin-like protein
MIYNAGSAYPSAGGSFGGISFSGNTTVNLLAPTSGTYAGVLIFQARDNSRALGLSGNASNSGGVLYAATAQLVLGGNANLPHLSAVVSTLLLSGGAFQLADGASSDFVSSTSNQILFGVLTVAVQDDAGAGLDPNEVSRISDAMTYVNGALGPFGVNLTWAAPGTEADVHIHFASSTPYGGTSDGVLGFTTAENDVYLVTGWNFYTGADPSGVGAGQYDFLTLATHELAHTVGLGESSDPGSVMYEYLTPGTVRRSFTDGNLALINTDADRFMKAAPAPVHGSQTLLRQAVNLAVFSAGSALLLDRAGENPFGWTTFPASLDPQHDGLAAMIPWLDGGDSVLAAGSGNDLVIGGQGRNLMVGGFGFDQLAEDRDEINDAGPGFDMFGNDTGLGW